MDGTVVVTFHGSLWPEQESAVDERLKDAAEIPGVRRVVADLSDVDFMIDVTFGSLLKAWARMRRRGVDLVVVAVPPIRRVFTITRVDQIIPVFDSLEEAGVSETDRKAA